MSREWRQCVVGGCYETAEAVTGAIRMPLCEFHARHFAYLEVNVDIYRLEFNSARAAAAQRALSEGVGTGCC